MKILLAAVTMGLSARWLYETLTMNLNELPSLCLAMASAVVIYFGLIYLFKVDEMALLMDELKQKLKRK